MAVGEAFLSAFLQVLFDRLASKHIIDFIRGRDIEKVLKKLKKTLTLIKAVLNNAEKKQIKNEAMKLWQDELEDVAYDAEDVLDEFATEALRWKMESESKTSSTQVWSLVPVSLNPSTFLFNVEVESKIEEITERLDDLSREISEFGLREFAGESSSTVLRETSSVVDVTRVHGQDQDKEKIIEQLLNDGSSSEQGFLVIPIVGMGGIGKTTLAQIVYNDNRVKNHFDLAAWACVSDDFNIKRTSNKILESFASTNCNFSHLDQIQVNIKETLAGKKFLIVLDDVWTSRYHDWDIFQAPLRGATQGSAVIVTTRNLEVASMMGTIKNYCLKLLCQDDCWSVFLKHAFKNGNTTKDPKLLDIGQKIAEKCKGLPLVASTLGGLLCSKYDENEWWKVLNSNVLDLPDESGILPYFRLSYHHLPSDLKRCFLYCAIFPKGFEFGEREVVLLWMAEGFLHQSGEKQMEDLGHEYFQDLVSRSLFQPSNGSKSLYVMHDLINELAQWLAKETCFRLEGQSDSKISRRARHSAYAGGKHDCIKMFKAYRETKYLRTFLPLGQPSPTACYLTPYVPTRLLSKLPCLRVLSLSGYCITKLPNSIGDLKHLRYLDISRTQIRRLPGSISTLYNLQTLMVEDCPRLKKLFAETGNLINLRHLNNSGEHLLEEMPSQLGKLTNLQTLNHYVVGKSSSCGIRELGPLLHLRGTLCISNLENVVDALDARRANLNSKLNIDVLLLKWGSNFDSSRNERLDRDVLQELQPHGKLKELVVRYYGSTKFPSWVGNPSLSCLVRLRFENCEKCTSLPPLGLLPSLRSLIIIGMSCLKSVGPEFYGENFSRPFPLLEMLRFKDMEELEDWIPSVAGSEEFPCLRELSIENCPKLQGKLPNHFPSLTNLFINSCEQLVVSINTIPMLHKLEIKRCKEVVHTEGAGFSSLKSMLVSNISKLTCLAENFVQEVKQVEEMKLVDCKELIFLWQNGMALQKQLASIHKLVVEGCPRLVSLVEEEEEVQPYHGLLCELESLELKDCKKLEKLPQALKLLTSLRELHIEACPALICSAVTTFPSKLKVVRIKDCNALSPLPSAVTCNGTCLEKLLIEGCDSLTCFGRGQLPHTLKRLEIRSCKNLQSLLDEEVGSSSFSSSEMNEWESINSSTTSALEFLLVEECPSLTSLSSIGALPAGVLKYLQLGLCSELTSLSLPEGLKQLSIEFCPKLESIAEEFQNDLPLERIDIRFCGNLKSLPKGLHNLSNLCEITIIQCLSLPYFLEERLPISGLRELCISNCENLKALPGCMHNLASLEELRLYDCPGIVSFPEEGFPTNLTLLEIVNLNICMPLFEWGLHKLSSLRHLRIEGGCPDVLSFPLEGIEMMLPTSLNSLGITDFPNLEHLFSMGFQSLSSLQFLYIFECPKLASFPRMGLPHTLLKLYILGCPLLQERCKKGKGQEWSKIAHIPYVDVGGRSISDHTEEEE